MLTKLEAEERAERIWPLRGNKVSPAGRHAPGEWYVDQDVGADRHHKLDGNGHPVCHRSCQEIEDLLP